MNKSPLEHIPKGILNGHASLGGIGSNLNFFRVISVYHQHCPG
jgi:hypothetical protein